jgi:hypothetical protein
MKEKTDEVKYWCFPEIDPRMYKKSLTSLKYFPDPLEHIVGFVCSDKRRTRPTPTKFINTTTSYISDVSKLDDSAEDFKSNVREPQIENLNLYPDTNFEFNAPPLEAASPKHSFKRPVLRTIVSKPGGDSVSPRRIV